MTLVKGPSRSLPIEVRSAFAMQTQLGLKDAMASHKGTPSTPWGRKWCNIHLRVD